MRRPAAPAATGLGHDLVHLEVEPCCRKNGMQNFHCRLTHRFICVAKPQQMPWERGGPEQATQKPRKPTNSLR